MAGIKDDLKLKEIDPLATRLKEAGFEGGASKKLGNIKLKRVKKIIQKTPNKNFKDYDKSGKDRKKEAKLQQQKIKNKSEAKGYPYQPPFLAKGGRVEAKKGGSMCKLAIKGKGKAYGKNS